MKTLDAVTFFRGLDRYNTLDMPLSRKLSYAVSINRKRLLPFMEAYDENMRAIVEKYAARDEKGAMIPSGPAGVKIDPDRAQEYIAEIDVLNKEQIEFDIHKVEWDMIPNEFPPVMVAALEPMLREPSTPVPLRAVE